MDGILIGIVALVFLAAGFGLGLYLRRVGIAAATVVARQDADHQLAVMREQLGTRDEALYEAKRQATMSATALAEVQERVIALTADAAKAWGEAGQLPALRTAIDEATTTIKAAKEDAAKAAISAAENAAKVAKLEPEVSDLKARAAAIERELEAARQQVAAGTERAAKLQAELEGLEQRRADTAAELQTARESGAKVVIELDAVRKEAAGLKAELAKAVAALSAEKRYGEAEQQVAALAFTAANAPADRKGKRTLEERNQLSRFARDARLVGRTLGILQRPPAEALGAIRDRATARRGIDRDFVERKLAECAEARREKNFARSDAIRDELKALGVAIMDTPQGTTWKVE